jgi:hypothetical protein
MSGGTVNQLAWVSSGLAEAVHARFANHANLRFEPAGA